VKFGARSKKYRGFSAWFVQAVGACVFFLSVSGVWANSFEETIRILENNTSFHWGRDCLVWIVYYPEDIVDPWVESEAGRSGMTESERESYKRSFISDLSIGKLEPFLFTAYAFGPRPIFFSPISDTVALVTADGERVKPVKYDRALDQSIHGLVQGLIFFPKQRKEHFAVAVRGMGVYDERLFSFSPQIIGEPFASVPEKETEPEVVIVELPPAPRKPPPSTPPRRETPKAAETSPPTPPIPPSAPIIPAPEIVVIEPEESQSMAEFIESLRRGRKDGKGEEAVSKDTQDGTDEQDADSAYVSREKTLRTFLDFWIKQDARAMYTMLSEDSQKRFSREAFESELRKAADFRAALRDGYTLDWPSTERAKITVAKRLLLIRTLASRTFGVAREGFAWKIFW